MWLLLTLMSFMIAIAGHAALCRMPLRLDFVAKSLLVGAPVGLLLGAVQVAAYGLAIQTIASLLLYAFLFELYIFFFTLVSTSVSVALLLKLSAHPLTASEIGNHYSTTDMVEGRIEKMLRTNLLAHDGVNYRVTRKARMLLVPLRLLRFFFHQPSGRTRAHEKPHLET